ncbi:G1 family glutamic endopeptidase [Streptomyces sp. NPDC101175]|uniref:G1 family glutamic endopeptidase n=1 Tax=Streptomyces sp. NPDC101175 TaxID=3366123 RepID=UPI003832C376
MLRRLRISLVALALAALSALPLATSANAAVIVYDSGYLTTNATAAATEATASWSQPAGTCTSVDSGARFWTGVGGLDGSPGAWVGTDTDCSGGSPVYYGWYRAPGTSEFVSYGNAISAGDVMEATATCDSASCAMILRDVTANWIVRSVQPLSGTPHRAEAMISRNGSQPLTNFGTVTFSPVLFEGSVATPSGTTQILIIGPSGRLDTISDLNTFTDPNTGLESNSFSGTWVRAT